MTKKNLTKFFLNLPKRVISVTVWTVHLLCTQMSTSSGGCFVTLQCRVKPLIDGDVISTWSQDWRGSCYYQTLFIVNWNNWPRRCNWTLSQQNKETCWRFYFRSTSYTTPMACKGFSGQIQWSWPFCQNIKSFGTNAGLPRLLNLNHIAYNKRRP